MSVSILFRVTAESLPVGFIPDLVSRYDLRFLVRETASNVHFQGVVVGNYNTVRSYFKKAFAANKEYSLKRIAVGDDETAVQYLCKGANKETSPEVLYNVGFDIPTLHSRYWAVNTELKEASKKRKAGPILETCFEDIRTGLHASSAEIEIGCAILTWYRAKRLRIPSSFNIGTMIGTYVLWLNDSASEINPNEFRRLYPNLGF